MVRADQLDAIFGPDSFGNTLEQRAFTSLRRFVRSEDHLAFDSPEATGRSLSAWEALKVFGIEILAEILEYGSAIIAVNDTEPSASLRSKRELFDQKIETVAKIAGVKVEEVEDAESSKTRTSIHVLTKIAQALQLDDMRLSISPGGGSDALYSYRLRDIAKARQFTPNTIFALNEAAWVVAKQAELSAWLVEVGEKEPLPSKGFEFDSRYGSRSYPAWKCGFDLAHSTRSLLNIDKSTPVPLRALIEDQLDIPVVQIHMDKFVAGATIAVGETRGIVVNLNGENRNDLVKRATMAHELCHLLWDPEPNFQRLTVDNYDELDRDFHDIGDSQEARANAFSVEFLAPQEETERVFREHSDQSSGLRAVMDFFGISCTAAKWHVYNVMERKIDLGGLLVSNVSCSDEWKAHESFATDIFYPKTTPLSRRGKFAYYVAKCLRCGLISTNSAAIYLKCEEGDVNDGVDFILSLYHNYT